MARKNIQDDGSYQKSQKLGNSKDKFGNSPQMSEWEESRPGESIKRYRLPLDSDGNPALGFSPIDITKTEGEPEFGGRLTKSIKGTTEKSDQGINIHIGKRRDKTDDVKYDKVEKKFKDKDGNTISDSDLYYEDKMGIIARDAGRKHLLDRLEGKRRLVDPRLRDPRIRDIDGAGINKPEPADNKSYSKKEKK